MVLSSLAETALTVPPQPYSTLGFQLAGFGNSLSENCLQYRLLKKSLRPFVVIFRWQLFIACAVTIYWLRFSFKSVESQKNQQTFENTVSFEENLVWTWKTIRQNKTFYIMAQYCKKFPLPEGIMSYNRKIGRRWTRHIFQDKNYQEQKPLFCT